MKTVDYFLSLSLLIAALSGGCAVGGVTADSGPFTPPGDGGPRDAMIGEGGMMDGAVDAGPPRDSGPPVDVGPQPDTGPRDAGTDAGPPDTGPPDAGTDAGPVDAGPVPCAPTTTNLAIVEFMPRTVGGTLPDPGEWIEIRSFETRASCSGVDLTGVSVVVNAGTLITFTGGVVPRTGQFVVAASSNTAVNGGLTPNVAWPDTAAKIGNSGETLILRIGSTTIHSVGPTNTATLTSGTSLAFSRSTPLSGIANFSNWCAATTAYGTSTFKGTPGATNDCP